MVRGRELQRHFGKLVTYRHFNTWENVKVYLITGKSRMADMYMGNVWCYIQEMYGVICMWYELNCILWKELLCGWNSACISLKGCVSNG